MGKWGWKNPCASYTPPGNVVVAPVRKKPIKNQPPQVDQKSNNPKDVCSFNNLEFGGIMVPGFFLFRNKNCIQYELTILKM